MTIKLLYEIVKRGLFWVQEKIVKKGLSNVIRLSLSKGYDELESSKKVIFSKVSYMWQSYIMIDLSSETETRLSPLLL